MSASIRIWVLVQILSHLHRAAAPDAALGVNKHVKQSERTMPLQSDSFVDLISKGVFVDKTPLLGFIMRDLGPIPVAITCPRGWGKTVNLDMLRNFLEIPMHADGTRILPVNATPYYQLFTQGKYRCGNFNVELEKPPLISDEKYRVIVDRHFGQYPIIQFTFPDTVWTNESDDLGTLRRVISEACDQHRYILRVLDSRINDQLNISARERDRAILDKNFYTYYTQTGVNKWNWNELSFGMLEVFKMIKRHFKKKVIVLIDNFDRCLGIDDEPVRSFLTGVLKNNRYLQSGIFFGTLPLSLRKTQWYSYTTANVTYYHFPIAWRFQRFFGFTTQEMNLIYNYYRLTGQEREKMRYWYSGYKYNVYASELEFFPPGSEIEYESLLVHYEEMYNPLDVRNYITSRQFQPYWTRANSDDVYLDKVLDAPIYEFKLSRILNGNRFVRQPTFPINSYHLWHLHEDHNMATYNYLSGAGYLAIHKTMEDLTARNCTYKIPNYEVASYLQRRYGDKLKIKLQGPLLDGFEKTTAAWERFLLGDELASTVELENATRAFAESLFTRLEKIKLNWFRSPPKKVLFDTLTMSMAVSQIFQFTGWQFGNLPTNGINDTTIMSDMILSSETRGVVIYVQNPRNATDLTNRTEQCTGMIEKYATFHRWKDVKVVDCRVFAKKRIEVTNIVCPMNLAG